MSDPGQQSLGRPSLTCDMFQVALQLPYGTYQAAVVLKDGILCTYHRYAVDVRLMDSGMVSSSYLDSIPFNLGCEAS